jgi:selenocysteine-specific elongation factor
VPPGARCAVNLQGAPLAELRRGMLLATPDAVDPTSAFDAQVDWLELAPPCEKPVSLELLVGTAERRARLAPIGAPSLRPGSRGFARIHVEGEPLALLPGDRFVLRGFRRTPMGGTTVGGGRVLDAAPPHRRRSDPALHRELLLLADGDALAELAARIRRAGLAGAGRDRLRRESGLAPEPLAAALAELAARGEACETASGIWLAPAALREIGERLARALDAYHAAQPLQPGMPAGALRGQLPANVPADAVEAALAALVAAGDARVEGDRVRRPAHRPELAAADAGLAARILADADAAGLEPPPLREWSRRLAVAPERLRDLLAHLEREGRLVRAGSDLWFARAAVAALRERVVAHLREHGRLTTPAYKALIGTSRRTAVPLMELFDDERVTLRRGDVRLPRRS